MRPATFAGAAFAAVVLFGLSAGGCVSAGKYKELEAAHSQTSQNLTQANDRIAALEKAKADAEAKVAELKGKITEQTAKIADLEKKRDQLEGDNKKLSDDLGAKEGQVAKLLAALQSDLKDAQKSLESAQAKTGQYLEQSKPAEKKVEETPASKKAEPARDTKKQDSQLVP